MDSDRLEPPHPNPLPCGERESGRAAFAALLLRRCLMIHCRSVVAIALCSGFMLTAAPASAQNSVADFYKGKTITFLIGYGVGGGYDLFARTISKHMGRHIPGNPTILPVNMPGASSMILGNHLAKREPQDGT